MLINGIENCKSTKTLKVSCCSVVDSWCVNQPAYARIYENELAAESRRRVRTEQDQFEAE